MNMDLLRGCFDGLRKDAASGIDRVTKKEYAKNLLENLTGLVERLHRMAYIPQPVLRVYIPYPAPPRCRPTTPATINSIEPTFNKDTGS